MDKELMEAKAAAEECFRRKARRAGLEGMLPTGRPMMDQEIDDLSERLGYGVGSSERCGRVDLMEHLLCECYSSTTWSCYRTDWQKS
jgi:hypothetical protein